MNYRPLSLACYCGEVPDRILEVGFTSDRHMVVHFWCSSCNRVLFVSHTMEECEAHCPPPEEAATPAGSPEDDARFLQSIGIRTE